MTSAITTAKTRRLATLHIVVVVLVWGFLFLMWAGGGVRMAGLQLEHGHGDIKKRLLRVGHSPSP